MKLLAWSALPIFAVSAFALVIPSSTQSSHDAAATIAGSIVQTNTSHSPSSSREVLELEYQKLELLKHQLFQISREVLKQEREILHLINNDFKSCSGVKCYLQTALRKAPDLFELFKTHFRHHAEDSDHLHGCLWSSNSSRALVTPAEPLPSGVVSTNSDNGFSFDESNDKGSTPTFGGDVPEPSSYEGHRPLPHDDPFYFGEDHDDRPTFDFDRPPPPPPADEPFDFDRPDDYHQGPPRPRPGNHPDHHDESFPNHSSYDPSKPNDARPASHPQDSHVYSGSNPHRERPPFRMPHPAPRSRHYKLILAVAAFAISLVTFAVLFKALRLYCANPRVRAERAARIEECRTRREYRKAACQHRLRQCLSRFRRRPRDRSTGDYEEKRAMLRAGSTNNQSNAENHIIGADINSLRRAHEIVDHLMRAEEGRSSSFPSQQPYIEAGNHGQPEVIASSSRSLRSIRTVTTLPPYAPPPPRYSLELEPDMQVVDGFRYTPTQSGATVTSSASSFILDDDVTESSVVDCRSRMSMDTETETEVGDFGASTRYVLSRSSSHAQPRKSLELAGDQYRGRFD